jgi:hypothetical protein
VTKDAIEHALNELMKQYSYKNPQVGRLYICMAGHGLLDEISGSSVFCCSDYVSEDSYATSYPLKELKSKLERIGLKHQVVHLDCCHAGGIFADRRDETIDYDLINMAQRPSVSAITAVTKAEVSLETNGHGIFSKHLCDQVKEEYIFQRHNRDYVTMTELFSAVRKQVSNMARNDFKQDMTPVHGNVLWQHLKEQCCGQMLFFKPGLNTANLGVASWGGGGGGGGGGGAIQSRGEMKQRSSPRTRKIATGHTITVPLSKELTIFLAGPSDFKIHTDLSAVLSSLSVSTVYELALLDQSGRDQVHAALTKKPEQRRWKKHAAAKLNPLKSGYEDAMLHLGTQLQSANTIKELVQVGCTHEIATAALAWFQENGYEEMEDLVDVEEEEVGEFVEAMVVVGGRGVELQRRATMVVQTAKEKVNIEKAAREKVAREKVAREKVAREKVAREKAAREKAAAEKVAREKAAAETAAREKVAREKAALLAKFPVGCYVTWTSSDSEVPSGTVGVIGSVNAESEKASIQFPKGTWNFPLLSLQQSTKAASEKQEKAAREKAAEEKMAREKVAREKAARENDAREKAAREKVAREKAERLARGEVRVPEDCNTLKAAVGRVHGDDRLTTIVVGKGEHQIDGDTLCISSAMNIVGDPGVSKSEIVVVGRIRFKRGIQGNCHLQHLTLRQAKYCGVAGESSFTMDDVLVEQCSGYGVCAYGTGVVGRCTNVEVRQCQGSGVIANGGASITLIGTKTTVHHNCTTGGSDEYGLKVYDSSTIQLVFPLTKEQVSLDNGGGGNWGAAYGGDINQIKTISQYRVK